MYVYVSMKQIAQSKQVACGDGEMMHRKLDVQYP